MKKKKRLIFWGIGLILLFWIGKTIAKFVSAFNEDEGYSETQLQEYLNVFPENKRPVLSNVWNYNSKKRKQFSLFDYGHNRRYSLLMYKFPIISQFTLDSIHFPNEGDIDTKGVYTQMNRSNLDFYYRAGQPEKAGNIFIVYKGDGLRRVIANDSMVAYYLKFRSLGFRYNKNEFVDIYGQSFDAITDLPLTFLFLKRDKAVYLLVSSVNNYKDSIPPDFLYKLVSPDE